MSDRVASPQQGGPASEQRPGKAEKRAAEKIAAAEAAAAKRRRQALTGAVAGLATLGAILAVVIVLNNTTRSAETDAAPAAAPATAASEAAPPANPGFPPLPPGADAALAQKPAVTAGSGDLEKLTVTPLVKGTGPAAQAGQTITVNYVGVSYRTGEEFDSSWKRSEPFSFQLGGNVIPGWNQGLVGVKAGSRVQLDIPAALAYGDNPGGGEPAGPLRFVVDVLAAQ
ncbi:FKBP-type peptidyl-prolyl cis-trans isomerase [Micromonospora sp. NPDC049679]|uniref:FKBP-type peptidyl-prolyl cis-trans isomerase n=1 Tax=Micromonospora sp. NPDC049679 TaxID=3155920 RepID=UPI0034004E7A